MVTSILSFRLLLSSPPALDDCRLSSMKLEDWLFSDSPKLCDRLRGVRGVDMVLGRLGGCGGVMGVL